MVLTFLFFQELSVEFFQIDFVEIHIVFIKPIKLIQIIYIFECFFWKFVLKPKIWIKTINFIKKDKNFTLNLKKGLPFNTNHDIINTNLNKNLYFLGGFYEIWSRNDNFYYPHC